ncbi:nucleotidyl transferase AbiEii/AbiGii toxin family protein [Nocardia fluminea]|uniref:nucleotidyl transferase AbiEii/AbiGii toxin family protein n=1 Tax=Nocardia fluminea TaxID=134984 RepID=UPI003D099964
MGGTALARTHLVGGRLSEDIDLVALDNKCWQPNSTLLYRDRSREAMVAWNGRRR